MTEIPVWLDDQNLHDRYRDILEMATHYYRTNTRPEIEPFIQFNHDQARFSDNWNIKYSGYLTMLYGFEAESDYRDAVKSKISSWNRVLGRIKRDEKMTDKNLGYIEEIKAGCMIPFGDMQLMIGGFGQEYDEIISCVKNSSGDIDESGESEE